MNPQETADAIVKALEDEGFPYPAAIERVSHEEMRVIAKATYDTWYDALEERLADISRKNNWPGKVRITASWGDESWGWIKRQKMNIVSEYVPKAVKA